MHLRTEGNHVANFRKFGFILYWLDSNKTGGHFVRVLYYIQEAARLLDILCCQTSNFDHAFNQCISSMFQIDSCDINARLSGKRACPSIYMSWVGRAVGDLKYECCFFFGYYGPSLSEVSGFIVGLLVMKSNIILVKKRSIFSYVNHGFIGKACVIMFR